MRLPHVLTPTDYRFQNGRVKPPRLPHRGFYFHHSDKVQLHRIIGVYSPRPVAGINYKPCCRPQGNKKNGKKALAGSPLFESRLNKTQARATRAVKGYRKGNTITVPGLYPDVKKRLLKQERDIQRLLSEVDSIKLHTTTPDTLLFFWHLNFVFIPIIIFFLRIRFSSVISHIQSTAERLSLSWRRPIIRLAGISVLKAFNVRDRLGRGCF